MKPNISTPAPNISTVAVPMRTVESRSCDSVSSEKFFAPHSLRDRFGQNIKRRAVAILRVVVIFFTGEQPADDVGIDGFVRVHRPFAELRQADGEREQGDDDKDRPTDFG